MILDSETKAGELPEHHGDELRLWLRLLTCTTLIEGEVRSRLRERFDVTLPRFDLMAQLDKVPEGMTVTTAPAPAELLTISIEDTKSGGTLHVDWGTSRASIPFTTM